MKKKEGKETPPIAFPNGYDYLNEQLAPALQRWDEINRQLAEYAKASEIPAKPYKYELRPPGTVGNRPSINWEYQKEKLNGEKAQLGTNVTQRVDWQLQMTGADEKTIALVHEAVDRRIYPNAYEGMSVKEVQIAKKQPKELEQSQDWMRDRLVRFRNPTSKEKEQNPLDASQQIMQKQMQRVKMKEAEGKLKETPTMSISSRFSQGLSYSKSFNKEEPGLHSLQKGKNDPSLDKD